VRTGSGSLRWPPSLEALAPPDTLRVLLVEDNPGDAVLGLRALTAHDFAVEHVETVAAALARLATGDIDCVVLDLDLPDARGLDGLDRLLSAHPRLAVVVLTGHGEELGAAAVRVGAQDYLTKRTLDGELLRRAVRYAVERRAALEHQRATDEYVERIVESALEGIWLVDGTGVTLFANAAMASMLRTTPPDMLGRSFLEWVHPSALEIARATFERRRDGTAEQLAARFERADGTILDAVLSVSPVSGPDGEFEGALAVVSDLAEHDLTAAAVAASERRYRALTELATDLLLVIDRSGVVTFVPNRTAARLGYRACDLIGTNIIELFDAATRDTAARILESLVRPEQSSVIRVRLRHGDGAWRWVEGTVRNVVHESAVGGLVANLHDITDRLAAEEREQHLAAIVASSDDAIVGIALDGTVTSWNAGAEHLYGYDASEMVGRAIDVIVPEDERKQHRRLLVRARHERIDHELVDRVRRDGSTVPVSLSVSPILDGAGNVVGTASIARDMTAAVAAAAALAAAEAHFHRLFTYSPAAQCVVDLAGRFVAVNPAMCQLLGRDEATLLDLGAGDITPPDQLAAFQARLEAFRSGTADAFHVERAFLHADGRRVDVLLSATVLRDESGAPVRVVASFVDITERKRAEEDLRRSEALLRGVVANTPVVLIQFDRDGVVTFVDGKGLEALGAEPGSLLGVAGPDYLAATPALSHAVRRALRGEPTQVVADFGGVTWSVRYEPLRDDDGDITGCLGVAMDITEQHRAERAVRASEERFRALVQHGSDVIAIIGHDGGVRYMSPSVERVLGRDPDWCSGQAAQAWIHPDDLAAAAGAFEQALRDPQARPVLEIRVQHRDGSWRVLEAMATGVVDVPEVAGVVVNAHDVTERKQAEAALMHEALHDSLTGLPNRALFLDRLGQCLARSQRSGAATTVLFVDIDRFKVVNDSMGHFAGDKVLVAAAEAIRGVVRAADTVSRLGGDEFAICCEGVSRAGASALAERIAEALADPIVVDGRTLYLTASIGITESRSNEDTPETMLRDADTAMYRAKERGRARCEVFDDVLRRRATDRLDLESGLRRAIAENELRLHYQPQFDLRTGEVVGAEALVRWQRPGSGLVAPDAFIPLAEETGLVVPLGAWVLRQACTEAVLLPGPVSVNLSGRQLTDDGLLDVVAATLDATGCDPARLWLEITETVVMADAERNAEVLARLRDLGVRIAIDDLGTGYSSLAYLKRFPVDFLKIDRSFVDGLGTEADDSAIVAAIIDLAASLRLGVIAEGVETELQRDELRRLGCDVGQGYLWSPAVPLCELVTSPVVATATLTAV
jgi:diguanylate cyclase (GGDEF)-like protein/PAS domain S-box-containing protein